MSPDGILATIQPREQGASTILFAVLVSLILLTGTIGPATATIHSPSATSVAQYADDDPLVDDSEAVDNSSVVVNGDGNVVSGKEVSYGDPVGEVIRVYTLNGLEKTDSVIVRGDNVVTRTGQNVVVEGGSVGVFDDSPDIRARFDNGTVEKVVVNGSNIETESGTNVKTEDGDNIEINRDAYNEHEFVIDILNTSDVGEGEMMKITAKVGNIGHATGEEVVEVNAGGRSYSPKMLELDPGETREIEFKYRTWSGDAPSIELTAKTPHDSDTVTAPVAKPDFRVNIQDASLAVSNGETITVPATVDRTGGATERTYAVDFLVDGEVVETELVSLEGGGEADLEFSYKTDSSDVPTVLATVAGPDGANASEEIAVRRPILAANQVYPPENISEYEDVDVTAKIENYGTDTKNQTVQLVLSKNGTNSTTIADEKQVEVGNRSAKNVTFSYHTKPEFHPKHQLTVQTSDHERTVTVKTNSTAVHQFKSAPEGNISAAPDGTYTLRPTVKNLGHANGTANVTFKLNGSVKKAKNLTLAAGDTDSAQLEVEVPANASVKYKIATQHDSTNGTIFPSSSDAVSQDGASTSTADGEPETGTASETTNSGNGGEGGDGGGGGLLGFLPPIPIIITTGFSVLLVGLIAHAAT